jgi:hypothetical protein
MIPGMERAFAAEFDDALQAMYLDLEHPPATLQVDLDRVARRLKMPLEPRVREPAELS